MFALSSLSFKRSSSLFSSVKRLVSICEQNQRQRWEMFEREKNRQLEKARLNLEKIQVNVSIGLPAKEETHDSLSLLMNQDQSTPYDCARHISSHMLNQSALAQIEAKNGELQYFDMHTPLKCEFKNISGHVPLKLLTFTSPDVTIAQEVNKAFWRSCCFILGALIEMSLKEENKVILHSWPFVDYRKNSCFVYDAKIDQLSHWNPSKEELDILSRTAVSKILQNEHFFEPLNVTGDIAEEIFADNSFKMKQARLVVEKYGFVRIYRLGNHVDMSRGPMVSKSTQIGRFSITNAFPLPDSKNMYRFQGVALPYQQRVTSLTWQVIKEAAEKPNLTKSIFQKEFEEKPDKSNFAASV